MQWNTKARQAALTTLICLSLSAPVFAMPTGGVATSGSDVAISTGDLSNVQSGATITANKNSIINWQEFGIKEGETLNFNTANGALLNRVVGKNISELLGTLKQEGNNPLLLVNPNGILVGQNAVINAQALVLSTLAISDDEFNKIVGDADATGTFAPESGGTAGALTVQKGAKFNIDNLLALFGGTVNVADGVTFTMNGATNDKEDVALNVAAGNKITMHGGDVNYQDAMGDVTATKDNAVTFGGTVTNNSDSLNLTVQGGKVDVSNATFDMKGTGGVYVTAANSQGESSSQLTTNATAENTIKADKLTVKDGEQVILFGGAVSAKDSNITAKKGEIYAGNTLTTKMDKNENPTDTDVTAATKDNAITLDNTKFTSTAENTSTDESAGDMSIIGGAVTLENGTAVSSKGTVTVIAGKTFTTENDTGKLTAGAGNTVTIDKTSSVTAGADEEINIGANKIANAGTLTAGTKHTAEGSAVHYDDEKGLVVDKASEAETTPTEPTKPTEPTDQPTKPTDPAKTPEQKPFNAEDAKNIASGEELAGEAIKGNAHFAQRQEALVNSIEKLNEATDDRAAAGQMLGILQGIKNADLTTPEKQLLQLSVLNAYTPTQGRADDTDKKTKSDTVTTAAAAVDTQAVAATVTAGDAANETAVTVEQ